VRSNYWSCSRFADFIRGTPKPRAGTGREWQLWGKLSQETYPIRHWIAEEVLDRVQDTVNWPRDRWADVRYYINNRWISRSHALTAHPRDIRPGAWCDVGNRFLPCMFNELVDFVEIEQAWHRCSWDNEARKKYSIPWYRSGWLRLRTWRCAEAGIDYLKWASELKLDHHMGVDPGHDNYGEPTGQALAAREILELYMWWKEVRPQRPDPHDVSGWTEYCVNRRRSGYDFFDMEDRTPEEEETAKIALDKSQEIEEAHEREDEQMMIRLIRVRNSLWT